MIITLYHHVKKNSFTISNWYYNNEYKKVKVLLIQHGMMCPVMGTVHVVIYILAFSLFILTRGLLWDRGTLLIQFDASTVHLCEMVLEDVGWYYALLLLNSILCVYQKADKSHLDSKVNKSTFDTTLDDLNKLISDILGKLSGHVSCLAKYG